MTDFRDIIKHLETEYPDDFSEDRFQDDGIELLLNPLFHGLKDIVIDTDELSGRLHDLIFKLSPALQYYVMCYCATAYDHGYYEEK